MAQEIERKFLVSDGGWRRDADAGRAILQAYLCDGSKAVVRVRITDRTAAVLTIKSAQAGMSRAEFEYPVPLADAEQLVALRTGAVVSKVRFLVPHAGRRWEVDVYSGDNDGLVLAEIEIESETAEVQLPPWIGAEVTGHQRYYASRLARDPAKAWLGHAERVHGRTGFGG